MVKVFLCGDIFLKAPVKRIVSDELRKLIGSCDIAICDFEGPVQVNTAQSLKVGPSIHQSRESVKLLRDIGFNTFSLANNHIFDYGNDGLMATLEEVEKYRGCALGAGMNFSEAYKIKIFDFPLIKIGVCALSEFDFGVLADQGNRNGGFAWVNHPLVNKLLRQAKEAVDFLIVSVHAGIEDVPLPLREWRDRYRELCDNGADIVVGHHPHVPQPIEQYGKATIFYSIGNFYFDHPKFNNKKNLSFSLVLDIDKNSYKYRRIYHEQLNGVTECVENSQFDEYLNNLNVVFADNYDALIDQEVLYLYKTCYKRNYNVTLGSNLKDCFKSIIFPRAYIKKKELLCLHLLAGSHRYATVSALRLKYLKGYSGKYDDILRLIKKYDDLNSINLR